MSDNIQKYGPRCRLYLIQDKTGISVESHDDGSVLPDTRKGALLFPERVCFTSEDTSRPVAHEIQRWVERVVARRWRCKKNPIPPEIFECLTAKEAGEVFHRLWAEITGIWKKKLEDRFMNPGKFVKDHSFTNLTETPEYEEWGYIGGTLQRRT